jgi:hypothetical protein
LTVYANAAFAKACGADPTGRPWASLVTAASHLAVLDHLSKSSTDDVLIQLVASDGEPRSLRVFPSALAAGFAVVGEPPWDDHRALEARLMALNADLAVLARERQRQTRLLNEAECRLRESHWHLPKSSEVLSMCVSCHAVKTGAQTWEAAAEFLARTADFLSHGYCASCAALLEAESKVEG